VTDPSRYPAQVFWSDEDKGFIAIAPDLPGCSSFGDTQVQALAELQDAIEAWIEAARAANNPIPEPSDPAVRSQYSGKVLVRMPRELHARLASGAKAEEVSLNQYINYLLSTASAHSSNQEHNSRQVSRRAFDWAVHHSLVLNTSQLNQTVIIPLGNIFTAVTTERLKLVEDKYG
jgi:predicted RNase H-like HicB family nuclease